MAVHASAGQAPGQPLVGMLIKLPAAQTVQLAHVAALAVVE